MVEKLILTLPPVRLDQPLYIALMQQAASEDRSASYVVREALRSYLEAHGRIVTSDTEDSK
jgi:hypothetical protein